MKNYVALAAVLLIGVFLFGCVQQQSPAVTPAASPSPTITAAPTAMPTHSPNLYKSGKYNFSIEYPQGWEVAENVNTPEYHADLAFLSPAKDGARANFSIGVQYSRGVYLPQQYFQGVKSLISQHLAANDYVLVSEGDPNIDNQEAYFLVYAYNFGGHPYKVKQVFLITGGSSIYIITYGSLKDKFDGYIADFDKSVSTFKLVK
jgi:hypothetical protein